MAFRVVAMLLLPAQFVGAFLLPPSDHHYTLTHLALWCLAAPWVWLAAGWLAVRYLRPAPRWLRAGAIGVLAAVGVAVGYSVLVEPQLLRVRSYEIAIRDLPESLDGLRVVHVSDTHHGPFVSSGQVKEVVAAANAQNPDLVVLTGDYVHRTPRSVAPGVALLSGLKARHGVVAVLGNHDHWEGAAEVRRALGAASIKDISGARAFLSAESRISESASSSSVCLAGLGDLWENPTDSAGIAAIFSGLDPFIPRIVLAHNPDSAEESAPGCRIDLMFSGHTHGGQVRLPFLGTPVVPSDHGAKYAGGLCHGPQFPVVVSRGIGMAILPVRFGVPPEIGIIRLVRRR